MRMPDVASHRPRPRHSGILLVALALIAALAASPHVAAADGWSLIFQDEFNQAALDRNQWYTRFIYENGTLDHFNDEKERYRDNGNHVLAGGVLSLIAKKPNSSGLYESGMIRSRRTFRYGYVEARLKLPAARGVFPAFWMVSDYDAKGLTDWPPEIDIMEFAPNGVNEFTNMVHSNVALSQPNTQGGQWYNHDTNYNQQWKFYRAPTDMTRDWHVYGMLWEKDNSVAVFLDGKRLWSRQYRWLYKNGVVAPPAHLLINLAVGGAWAGLGGIDNAAFPAKLQVDYVRICQRATNSVGQTSCGGSRYTPK